MWRKHSFSKNPGVFHVKVDKETSRHGHNPRREKGILGYEIMGKYCCLRGFERTHSWLSQRERQGYGGNLQQVTVLWGKSEQGQAVFQFGELFIGDAVVVDDQAVAVLGWDSAVIVSAQAVDTNACRLKLGD